MRYVTLLAVLVAAVCAASTGPAQSQPAATGATRVAYIKPQYLPPAELARMLGAREVNGHAVIELPGTDGPHAVEVRRNDAANLLVVSGGAADVEAVEALVKATDVPPRQIAIEARIVEIDEDKSRDLGIDWSEIGTAAVVDWNRIKDVRKQSFDSRSEGLPPSKHSDQVDLTDDQLRTGASASLYRSLRLLDERGAATIRNAPRILTLNNRRATVLDGQRVTYITRYSSFTNLFVTDSLDAGLTLSVLPSLGESGYLTLDIRAELTSLTSNISGSPVKDGQIVENTVVVKDGQSVLLGGFQRTVESRTMRRFPLLGYVLPFLFSREQKTHSRIESFVVVTPRVVDLAATLDERTRGLMQGGEGK